jgi:glycosidase
MAIHVSKRAVAFLGSLGAAGAVALSPGVAQAAAYDGQDPVASGCSNTALTLQSVPFNYNGGVVGHIELRYSTNCRTVWARLTSKTSNGLAHVWRQSDSANYQCGGQSPGSLAWSSTLSAYSCYTVMLNDANVTSFAYGEIQYTNPAGYTDAQTSAY